MIAHLVMRSAPRGRQTKLAASRGWAMLLLGLIALLAQGCTRPRIAARSDPADATARVPTAMYRPVIGAYQNRRPLDPEPWRERNQDVAPEAKP